MPNNPAPIGPCQPAAFERKTTTATAKTLAGRETSQAPKEEESQELFQRNTETKTIPIRGRPWQSPVHKIPNSLNSRHSGSSFVSSVPSRIRKKQVTAVWWFSDSVNSTTHVVNQNGALLRLPLSFRKNSKFFQRLGHQKDPGTSLALLRWRIPYPDLASNLRGEFSIRKRSPMHRGFEAPKSVQFTLGKTLTSIGYLSWPELRRKNESIVPKEQHSRNHELICLDMLWHKW